MHPSPTWRSHISQFLAKASAMCSKCTCKTPHNRTTHQRLKTNLQQIRCKQTFRRTTHKKKLISNTSQTNTVTKVNPGDKQEFFFLEQHPLPPKKPPTKTTIAPTFSQEALHQTPRNTTSFPSVKKSEKPAISKSAIQTS